MRKAKTVFDATWKKQGLVILNFRKRVGKFELAVSRPSNSNFKAAHVLAQARHHGVLQNTLVTLRKFQSKHDDFSLGQRTQVEEK